MMRDYGRHECRDGHSYRALDAGSVHILDSCVRCGDLSFVGRGELFEQRRLDFLVVWSGKPRWYDDDLKLTDYPPPVELVRL